MSSGGDLAHSFGSFDCLTAAGMVTDKKEGVLRPQNRIINRFLSGANVHG